MHLVQKLDERVSILMDTKTEKYHVAIDGMIDMNVAYYNFTSAVEAAARMV